MHAGDDSRPIALLPAAGRAARLGLTCPKELLRLPLGLPGDAPEETRPICEYALTVCAVAGAAQALVVVAPGKGELGETLGNGARLGLPLAYLVQPQPRGLPDVVRLAAPWLEGRPVLLALPDTIVTPVESLREVERERRVSGADLVLGVFGVDEPEHLGPVEVDDDGAVLRVLDKPARSPVRNSWGVASWSPRFTRFCAEWAAARDGQPGEPALGHVFQAAVEQGLRVRAVRFEEHLLLDIGTPAGLSATWARLRSVRAAGG